MKTLFNYFALTLGFLLCTACTLSDDTVEATYYKFNDSDKALNIDYDYKIDQIITYQNQDGEQVHFKVIQNELKKASYYFRGSFAGGGGFSNYYDIKIIRFEIIENENYENVGLVNYIFSSNGGRFNNGINFPMWNIPDFTYIDEFQNPTNIIMTDFNTKPKTQMEINNHLFERVVSVESGSNEVYENYTYGSIIKNVNKIYYDYDFGIIQFEDIKGKEWQVVYP